MTIDPRMLLAALTVQRAVSSGELAQRLGVPRTLVRKEIQALRAIGAPIETAAGLGYRLARPLQLLDRDRLLAALPVALRQRIAAFDVHFRIDSTHSELLRARAREGAALSICLAEVQSAGRGRRGRVWESPLGGNVYFSLSWPSARGIAAQAGLSLAVGVALIEALADCGVRDVGIKWPNDVLAQGRKLAGMLVELGGDPRRCCYAVIGIGINVRLPAAQYARIDQPAIDLASLLADARIPSREALIVRLIERLVAALDRFDAMGFAVFREQYAGCDLLRGKSLRIVSGAQTFHGTAAGVDEKGTLLVRSGTQLLSFDSAEVSVRIDAS